VIFTLVLRYSYELKGLLLYVEIIQDMDVEHRVRSIYHSLLRVANAPFICLTQPNHPIG
jgi:hypothetical protein